MNSHYKKIEKAIRFINRNLRDQPSLDEIANSVGLSPFHFQRLFREWAGITPKRFLQFLTVSHAKQLLKESSVLDVSLEMGLSSQSRLHDHFLTLEALSPGQFKSAGKNLKIEFGLGTSPFGPVFMGATQSGVCHLSFVDEAEDFDLLDTMRREWPNADIVENRPRIEALSKKIFSHRTASNQKFHLLVQGSNFQIQVWKSLLCIPTGTVFSYRQIANLIGLPSGSRAVANAIAKNPIGYLIPCHRVIRNTGVIGGYRWGSDRKKAILGWEAAKTSRSSR